MYIIYSNLTLLILYVTAVTLLRKFTFHQMNRFILMAIPFISVAIPLVKLTGISVAVTQLLPTITPGIGVYTQETFTSSISLLEVFQFVFLTGVLISFILLLIKTFKLSIFIRSQQFVKHDSVNISSGTSNLSSFSFGKWIFINKADNKHYETIVEHEKWHHQLNHTYDNVIYELFRCFFWFNPVIYMMHKELRNNHEFQVDAFMNNGYVEENYLETVVQANSLMNEISLANNFNSKSNLVKRINMITKKSTNKRKRYIYLVLLPAVIFSMMIIACSEESNNILTEPEVETNVISGKDVQALSKQPNYPGGIEELYAYLGSGIKYPPEAKEQGIEGKVFVSFVIDELGRITKVNVNKSVHELLDEEAIRAISAMPEWTPGELDGVKVPVEYVLPIQFKLATDDMKDGQKNIENPPPPPLPPGDNSTENGN